MAIQSSQSAPGQLAAAIAKADPRSQAVTVHIPAAAQLLTEVEPGTPLGETLAKLTGREPGEQAPDRED